MAVPPTTPVMLVLRQPLSRRWTHVCVVAVMGVSLTGFVTGCSETDPGSAQPPSLQTPAAPPPTAPPPVLPDGPSVDAFEPLQTPAPSGPAASSPAAAVDTSVENSVSAAIRLRLPDDRPDINELRLEQAGIQRYTSRRLVLLSDLPEADVRQLPELADQLFDALEAYFGPLPDATDDSPFQVTGCLIGDADRFRQAGLMPEAEFTFSHGRHLNYQFWMYNPTAEYYRRHLLLHEFTHCFMTCESGMLNIPPLWYIEGMAEYFATHQATKDDSGSNDHYEFGVLPESHTGFDGWGRISELRRSFSQQATGFGQEISRLTIAPLSQTMPNVGAYFETDFQYASSWAVCWFLNHHPTCREQFQPLAKTRTNSEFLSTLEPIRDRLLPQLAIDWLLFVEDLAEGYNTALSFPKHSNDAVSVPQLRDQGARTFTLETRHGWQDTGVRLEHNDVVHVSSRGRYQVNDQPQPWISETQGVSIEYVRALPLGQVVGILVSSDGEIISNRFAIGRNADIKAPFAASLWLQVNDHSNSRGNNSADADITLTAVP